MISVIMHRFDLQPVFKAPFSNTVNKSLTVKPTQQFRKAMQNNLSILYPFGKFGGVTYVKVMDAIREKFTLVPTDYQHQF